MSAPIRKLRLGPLPSAVSVKLTFACSAGLKADLDRYAALHAQAYGEAVDTATLIPHMLEALMAGDRQFRKEVGSRPFRPKPTQHSALAPSVGQDVLVEDH